MKRIHNPLILSLLGLVLLAACGQEAEEPTTEQQTTMSEKTTVDVKPYPYDFCVVSGEKLGSMGEPARIVFEGQEIKFCCAGCIPDFKENSAKYLAMVADPSLLPDSLGKAHMHPEGDEG